MQLIFNLVAALIHCHSNFGKIDLIVAVSPPPKNRPKNNIKEKQNKYLETDYKTKLP